MPFIKNEERKKRVEKLQSKDVGKRLFVLLSILVSSLFIILLVIMQMLPLIGNESIHEFAKNNLSDGKWIEWVASESDEAIEVSRFTPYGLMMFILTCIIIGMLVASFIVFLTMRSLKWGFKETMDLMMQPIPGQTGKFASKSSTKTIVGKRLGAEMPGKKKDNKKK